MAEFMKKMKSNIDKGLVSVSVTSTTMLEMTKINGLITALKENKQGLLSELGSLTYENHLNPHEMNEEKANGVIQQIKEIDEKIREREEQINKLKEEKEEVMNALSKESVKAQDANESGQTCSCGAKLLKDAAFCMGCGKKVEPIEENKLEEDTCVCGAVIKPGSKFCGKCGTKLVE